MNKKNSVLENIVGSQFGESTISMLLADFGIRYQCERIYIFYRDANGMYDCTDEWVNEGVQPKRDLLQNLSSNTVKPYLDYFARNGKLIVRDLDQIHETDDALYHMLKAQGLSSLLVGPLKYEGVDLGFIGMDNPQGDRFDELTDLFPIIQYVVSIQKHRQEIQNRILNPDSAVEEPFGNKKSMYDRAAELKEGAPLGLIYCSVIMTGEMENSYTQRVEAYVTHVLNSVFNYQNVFSLGKKEYLIIAEHTADKDLYDLQYFADQVKKTLSVTNIHLTSGVVLTDSYANDFFDMVNTANAYMQREIRRFREVFIGKYHLEKKDAEFRDLIEIRPKKDSYQVIYSEHLDNRIGFQGSWSEFYPKLLDTIVPEDKRKFIDFWNKNVLPRRDRSFHENMTPELFHFKLSDGEAISVEMHLTHYRDIHDDIVLMCYTK